MNDDETIQLLEHPTDQVPAEHASLGLRLCVAIWRSRLNNEIATGCNPAGSAERALRARQLCSPASRRRAARALRGAVAEADRRRSGISVAIPVSRRAVAEWREGLLGLADAVEFTQSVNPCGIARAYELVTDGASPLYNRAAAHSLGEWLWWISDGLHAS
jgi:hypothetical protein